MVFERNGNKIFKISIENDYDLDKQKNRILKNLTNNKIDKCLIYKPVFSCKLLKYTLQLCKKKKIAVFIESSEAIPKWVIEDLMSSPDNEVVVSLEKMNNSSYSKNPEKLLISILNCFHNGIHISLKIPSELSNDITEYDLINMISLFKNWIHVVIIDSSISYPKFKWKNIVDFIIENKVKLEDKKEVL